MSEALLRAPSAGRPEIAPRGAAAVALSEVILDAGPAAVERFLEFLAAAIANGRPRAAYGRAAGQFLTWCGARGLGLRAIAPLHVAADIRTHPGSARPSSSTWPPSGRSAAGSSSTRCCP